MIKFNSLLFTILLLATSLGSCTQEREKFTIGVSICSTDNWREQMQQEMSQEQLFYKDMSLEFKIADSDDSLQSQHINEFIRQGVDLLIVIPSRAELITEAVNRAYNSGVKVIIIDNNNTLEQYTAFLGVDNVEIGRRAGEYASTLISESAQIIELTGRPYTAVAQDRHEGFQDAISQHDNIEIICSIDCSWEEHSARHITDSLLRIYPNTKLIFAHNDEMAYGAYRAAKALSLDSKVSIIGVDAMAGDGNGIDLVSRGVLEASFLYPTFGNIVMQRAHEILHGLPHPRDTRFETAMINGVNAHIELLKIEQLRELDRRIYNLDRDIANHQQTNEMQRLLLIAISIVVLISILVATIIAWMMISKSRLNRLLEVQKIELEEQRDKLLELADNLKEATNAKMRFYTNISHDLRTPLTLVADPINYLLKSPEIEHHERDSLLKIASRNTSILLRLIDQILDFRRYENDKMTLNLTNCNISQLIKGWSADFNTSIERSGKVIRLSILPNLERHIMIDQEKIERIYFNLLSNAIKYSLDTTPICVELKSITKNNTEQISLIVKNHSKELTTEAINSLFERFYQVDSTALGSGIGLAITKAYVELHGGEIHATSSSGMFTINVTLPYTTAPHDEMQSTEIRDSNQEISQSKTPTPQTIDESKDVILIVDDNSDIRDYIRSLLKPLYTTLEAADGVEGLKLAESVIPDLIISDVMMDAMDGIELCHQIKSRPITSHIPVLLLTACAADEQRIEGYANGADGYISKPFNFNILISRIANLIKNRTIISRSLHYLNHEHDTTKVNTAPQQTEVTFLEQFTHYIQENLNDPNLNIDEISKSMGYSRSQLHRKIKAITGVAPVKIIREIRLTKADELLKTTSKSITDIAYEVGFSSPSYFTKCYKEYRISNFTCTKN